jgi:hypothetical protein
MPFSENIRRDAFAAYGAALLVALLFVTMLFPLSFLLGQGGYFQQGDAAQHVSGWLLFATDRWRFPLLVTQRIDAPTGVPIFLTDSLPLVALVHKPFAALLPEGFHYFGIWHGVIRIGQALGGVYLIRSFGCRSLFAAVVAAVFFVCWPANLFRFGHTALSTHAFLLFALGFYVRARRSKWTTTRTHLALALLSAAALLTHPYLGIMVLAVQTAFAIDRAWLDRTPLQNLIGVAAAVGGLALLLWPLGYFSSGVRSAGGYDIYSMNLLSPFCGGNYAPCGFVDATGGGQYEGMNTLGLGVLILLPLALFLARGRLRGAVASSPGFMLVALALTLYALSKSLAGSVSARALRRSVVPRSADRYLPRFRPVLLARGIRNSGGRVGNDPQGESSLGEWGHSCRACRAMGKHDIAAG